MSIFCSLMGRASRSLFPIEMKVSLMILLFGLSSPAFAGDFDNWYFKFISVERKVKGETFSADGKIVGTFTGKTFGETSADGKKFTENFEYTYMPEEHLAKDTLIWIRDEKGTFRSSTELHSGEKIWFELTLKAENQYQLKATFDDGKTCETSAQIREDGVLHAVDITKDVDGKVVLTLKYTRT